MSAIVRSAEAEDHPEILEITRSAFPDEDLVPLMSDLLVCDAVLTRVAEDAGTLCGYICWTVCSVDDGPEKVALLGPLAVLPTMQTQGIGSDLINAGLNELRDAGMVYALVLGDPGYYGRFGFSTETKINTPYPLPEEWRTGWQGQGLGGQAQSGTLQVPKPWRIPALWLP